jgi:hypothetical protein
LNLYGVVGNDGVARFDAYGLYPGKKYDSKQEAIGDAAFEVWNATAESVEAGVKEYTPDYSREKLAKLWGGGGDVLLSQDKNHMSAYINAGARVRTVYGVEHWTFVCCNKNTEKWSYGDIGRGRYPSLFGFAVRNWLGISGPSEEEFTNKGKIGCTYVHSHNMLIQEKSVMMAGSPIVDKSGTSELSPDDKVYARRIEIIAVADDNVITLGILPIPKRLD